MKTTFKFLLFLLLTVLTQIGGLVLLLSLMLYRFIDKSVIVRWQQLLVKVALFVILYLSATFTVVPPLAGMLGRVHLPIIEHNHVKPATVVTCLLNRNYVRPQLREVVYNAAAALHQRDSTFVLCYLDACFPFGNGFPLFPHLSHNDGKKIDLAFVYRYATDNTLSNSSPSVIGYGVSEGPRLGEEDRAAFCKKCGYTQYGLLNQLVPQSNHSRYVFDEALTALLVTQFVTDERIGKVFIEPHLKQRLGLQQYDKIRFQGCRSVRHDDHIHVQLK